MEGSKIKNIVIIFLALINAFFLSVVILNHVRDMSEKKHMEQNLSTLYENSGLALEVSKMPENIAADTVRLEVDRSWEEAAARAVLGEVMLASKGESTRAYNGAGGIAVFSPSGDFEMRLVSAADDYSGSEKEIAELILKEIGIRNGDGEIKIEDEKSESGRGSLALEYDGTPILNCCVEFEFQSKKPVYVNGTKIPQKLISTETAESISAITALTRALTYNLNGAVSFSEVRNIAGGYYYQSSSADQCTLTPAWKIYTDAGSFIIDAITGKIAEN